MAVDGAQYQYYKFCNSLKESKNELSGMPLISTFKAIEEYLRKDAKMITASPEESLKLLCSLNSILGECRIFAHQCNQLDKNIIRFNPLTIKWFLRRKRPKLNKIFVGIKNLMERERERERQELSSNHLRMLQTTRINGFDKMARDIEEVVLKGGGEDFIAYGITGMAGTGKSALAQQVFDSVEIRNKFRRRIWISLSDRGDIRVQSQKMDALINILLKCIPKELNDYKDDILKGTDYTDFFEVFLWVQNRLSEHKCLIVLDDIWQEKELYQSIRRGMSRDRAVRPNGGAIIVTSRQEDLVKRMLGEHGFTTRLDHKNELLKEDCWKIFEDAVKKEESISMDDPALVKIKDDIKYKIQGLPLAAETLAQIIPKQIKGK